MGRGGLVGLLFLVSLLFSPVAKAQDGTPSLDQSPWLFESEEMDRAARLWESPGHPGEPDSITSLYTAVHSFESPEVASRVMPSLLEWQYLGRGSSDTYRNIERVSAPRVGDEAELRDAVAYFDGSDPFHDIVFVFRSGPYLVVLGTTSLYTRAEDVDVAAIAGILVGIGQAIVGRTPSSEPRRIVDGLSVGGLFDLLPGYEEVPLGLTLSWEAPSPQITPTASALLRHSAYRAGC